MTKTLPMGWELAPLEDLLALMVTGKRPKGGVRGISEGILSLGGEHVADDGSLKLETPRYIPPNFAESIPNAQIQNDDILVVKDGATTGKVGYISSNSLPDKAYINEHLFLCRPHFEIEPRYLFNFLRSSVGKERILLDFRGAAQGGISREFGTKTVLPVAPLAEQKRIVDKLDALMSRSTRARQELAAIPNLIARYKQAILTAAFNGDLTADWRAKYRVSESASALIERTPTPMQPRGGREASERTIPGVAGLSVNHPNTEPPPGWCWTPITRIARQETGHTPSRSHPDWWVGEIPWIGIKDASLHHGGYIRDTIQHTNEQGLANSAARLLPTNTVCLSRTASVGYVVIMARPMATSQDFVTWSCTEALMPEYLAFALMAEGDDIRRFGKGSTHTTIYFPEVRALHICLAPIEEQIEIVKRVKVALEKINSIEKELSRTEKLRTRLEQATLAKAFRGELAPQDPSDEPASTLLDRIRATRQQSPQPKRGRKKS